ncbi:hypothetical protein AB9T88_00850, partial [Flavobacterium sp. LBUM151]
MKSYSLKFFKNKTVTNIYKVAINENSCIYNLLDTIVLKLLDDLFIQIIIDYDIKVYKLSSIEELVVLGDYDLKSIEIELVEISEMVNNQKIKTIYNYS